jgi:hypothetical protein
MGRLTVGMTHREAVQHLRKEVIGTARLETGPLLAIPAFFGAVRAIMSDLDYVAALYDGWDGKDWRKIATSKKAERFLRDAFSAATGDRQYSVMAEHIYGLYRHGTVHLRAPKQVKNIVCSTPILSWGLMEKRTERFDDKAGTRFVGTHLRPVKISAQRTVLPVSIRVLFSDFIKACRWFGDELDAERRAGGSKLLTRWRQTADALANPEPTKLRW